MALSTHERQETLRERLARLVATDPEPVRMTDDRAVLAAADDIRFLAGEAVKPLRVEYPEAFELYGPQDTGRILRRAAEILQERAGQRAPGRARWY